MSGQHEGREKGSVGGKKPGTKVFSGSLYMDRDVPTNSEFVSWQDGDVDATKLNTVFGLQRMLVKSQIRLSDCQDPVRCVGS